MSPGRLQYHFWFDLKPEIPVASALEAVRSFLGEQLDGGQIAGFRLLRKTSEEGKPLLPRYLALIEFRDRDQFSSTFGEMRRAGIHEGAHGRLMKLVADFRVEFTEAIG